MSRNAFERANLLFVPGHIIQRYKKETGRRSGRKIDDVSSEAVD